MRAYRFFLICIVVLMATTAVPAQSFDGSVADRLRQFIDVQGSLVYPALYALPETQTAFVLAAGSRAWNTYPPGELADLLSPEQKERILDAVNERLQALSIPDRANFFKRIRYWILTDKQFRIFTSLGSSEHTLGAAFALPQSRDLFNEILTEKGLDSEAVDPLLVGSTLASAERSALLYRVLTRLSSLSQYQQTEYYRDFYNLLLELLRPDA